MEIFIVILCVLGFVLTTFLLLNETKKGIDKKYGKPDLSTNSEMIFTPFPYTTRRKKIILKPKKVRFR